MISDYGAEDICGSFGERTGLLLCKVTGYWDTLSGTGIGKYSGNIF